MTFYLILAVVVLLILTLSVVLGTSAEKNKRPILEELQKRPLNLSSLVQKTGKSRRLVVSSLLTMQDKGYISTGAKGGMKRLSAIGDHTTFYITQQGREFLDSDRKE